MKQAWNGSTASSRGLSFIFDRRIYTARTVTVAAGESVDHGLGGNDCSKVPSTQGDRLLGLTMSE
jgi:hypothetical protein